MQKPPTPDPPPAKDGQPVRRPFDRSRSLRRSLGLWPLVLYGLGTIIGAGIYVLVGEVAAVAGMAAPLAFVLAGAIAALTGLSYAELVARHPEAAGEVAYVSEAFRRTWLARLTGYALIAVAIIAAASIAKGSAGYLQEFVALPRWIGSAAIVVTFTAVAAIGVTESVRVAAVMTLLEIGGLAFVIFAGGETALEFASEPEVMLPGNAAAWSGVLAGAFVAFFAFIGFDSLANMAEETRAVSRTLPRAILISVAVATLLYAVVAIVAVAVVPPAELAASKAPLVTVLQRSGVTVSEHFAAIALIATANGVMIEINLTARLAYGMARRGLAAHVFSIVNARTQTPVLATLCAGAVILALVVAVPFGALVQATSTVTLLVFTLVNLSLWRMKRRSPQPELSLTAPGWVPPLGAFTCAALLVAQLVL